MPRSGNNISSSSGSAETNQIEFPRILFTGIRPTDEEEQQINEIGGEVVDEVNEATHLVSTGIKRTAKFLEAICYGDIIMVSESWVQDSLSNMRWLPVPLLRDIPETNNNSNNTSRSNDLPVGFEYWLKDAKAEKQWGFSLIESLRRSSSKGLFAGSVVYVTGQTKPDAETLRPLVECAGGKVVTQFSSGKLRDLVKTSSTYYHDIVNPKSNTSNVIPSSSPPLLVISCSADKRTWSLFTNSRNSAHIPIYQTELLLVGLLRQKLPLDQHRLA